MEGHIPHLSVYFTAGVSTGSIEWLLQHHGACPSAALDEFVYVYYIGKMIIKQEGNVWEFGELWDDGTVIHTMGN